MKARDYQHKAALAVIEQWREVRSTLVVMPTATGKTVLFADIIRRCFPKRALVLAHREELVFQARDKIHRVTGYDVEVEMAGLRANMNGIHGRTHVVVSTIQTQTAGGDGGGRMGKFDPKDFGLLILDECHRATAKTFKRAIAYYSQNPNLKILGVTATPDRTDEEALGQVFDTVAFDYEILDAINDGWIVPVEQQVVEIDGLDFSSVRTTAGDLNGADLAAVMEAEKNLQGIADATIKIAGNRSCLVFAATVQQAEQLAEIFNRHRANSAGWICGKTPKEDRRRILGEFETESLQYMVNVGVLTEGYDNCNIRLIVMGTATKSRSRYAQMAGRAMRPLDEIVAALNAAPNAEARRAIIAACKKPTCCILDFAGNAGRHKLMTTADILGGNVSDEAVELAATMARKAGKPMRMDETLEAAEEELKKREERRQADAARRARLVAKAQFSVQNVDPFNAFHISPQKERGWDSGRTLSEKQRTLIVKHYPGVNVDQLPYAQGKQLLNELFRRWDQKLCTFKQARILAKRGYDTKNMTMAEAGKILDGLFGNKRTV